MTVDAGTEEPVSDYREYAPPPPLKSHLLCLWTQSIQEGGKAYHHRVLPDGCIDIVFINDEPPTVVGPWTESFIARLAPGTTIVGARFRQGFATGFLRVPAFAMLNQSVALQDIVANAVHAQFRRMADRTSLVGKRRVLGQILMNHLPHTSADRVVASAVDWFNTHPNGRVEQLSDWIGMSGRQLQRRFLAEVGYGPKTFQSVLRFQRLLHLASEKTNRRSLAGLAVEAGYADQAHMTREVNRFSNSCPTDLLGFARCTLCMSDLFQAEALEESASYIGGCAHATASP